ncbi:3-oxoacyl-ACP synthase III family protein [uncultured Cloacibacillus sp.]|uniref:3-oxoacyl-ACP synthase III family protein n=1 Tax=uncultured Cloacibacillus sp. TaxID=889794 RepID=UPI0026DC4E46|nr:ketoacyl-ACP synthase III [uncultured Cloacibacillus sp.]
MRISYYLPETVLTNEALETVYANPSWTAGKIYRKTGIKSRHIAGNELVSDMAVKAAQNLFAEYGVSPNCIDFVLLCTQSPDYILPTTACIVQERLGIPTTAGAMDFNLGCSGYVYGLAAAKGLLCAGVAHNILLITSETYTKHIHPLDRSTRTVFGDGASATYLTADDINNIGEFVLGTDGKGAPNLIIPSGAMAKPKTAETSQEHEDQSGNIRSEENIYMNGPEIYAFTLRTVPRLIQDTLAKNGLTIEQTDYIVLHQANKLVLTSLRDKLDIPDDKFCIDVEELGNTVSSTIPIAIKRAMERQPEKLKPGTKILIAGFGVGYSWGGTVITLR